MADKRSSHRDSEYAAQLKATAVRVALALGNKRAVSLTGVPVRTLTKWKSEYGVTKPKNLSRDWSRLVAECRTTSIANVARRHGTSPSSIRGAALRLGLSLESPYARRKATKEERRAVAYLAVLRGYRVAQDAFSRSSHFVSSCVKEYGGRWR